MDDSQYQLVSLAGIDLSVIVHGPKSGQPVVFLHGFPETACLSWSQQLQWFADRGYRVIAPDQRGYGASAKPTGVSSYALPRLAQDVVDLIRSQGWEKATVVGHDWGAAVTWYLADQHSEVVREAVILNVPHPAIMERELKRNPGQLLKSWYIFFFQLPWLPERLLSLGHYAWLRKTLLSSGEKDTFPQENLDEYVAAWKRPGALRAMINWYRAFVRYPVKIDPERKVGVPVLMIWGERDKFLDKSMARPSIEMCEQGELELIAEATHWVQHEFPDRVNARIERFLKSRHLIEG